MSQHHQVFQLRFEHNGKLVLKIGHHNVTHEFTCLKEALEFARNLSEHSEGDTRLEVYDVTGRQIIDTVV